MKLVRILSIVAVLVLTPMASFAKPVLSAGEVSVGAEFFPFNGLTSERTGLSPAYISGVSPHMGFNVRYALSQQLAAYGNFGLFHRVQKGPDPATFYSIGGGMEFNFLSTRSTAALFKGGIQFLPRPSSERASDEDFDFEDFDFSGFGFASGQDFGVRLFAGPGVEARVAEGLSLQIYSPLLDLQIGGDSTNFDFNLLPNLAIFIYF